METLPSAGTPVTADARGTAAEMRRLLGDLGADPELLRGVTIWADLGGREYVRVPSLPVGIVAHLVRLLPAGAAS